MSNTEPPEHISEQDARAGDTPHIVRYVLGLSMALVIIIFAAIFII